MVERDDEIKILGEIKIELESGTHKVIEKLSQEKVSQQEALEKFKWTIVRDHEIKVLGEVNAELEKIRVQMTFYGLMYDTDDDAIISEKSCEHFDWDWDSPGVVEEVIEMANDQAKTLSSDKEVTNECLDDEQVEKSRPSKRIRVMKEEMVKLQVPVDVESWPLFFIVVDRGAFG
nr:hypothetical protein [Tanacetum cinerariifolium]